MPNFNYKVKTETGKVLTGEVKIESEVELRRILEEKGYKVVEIVEKTPLTDITEIKYFQKRVKINDLAIFCRQFAIVLEAGVPIAQCLEVLKLQTTNPTLRRRINEIYEDIQKGIALSSAFRKHEDIFPQFLINMVEAGEVSGQLDIVFQRVASYFENQSKLNSKIKGALAYPVVVCIVAVLVVIVLMVAVVPQFVEILQDLGGELPLITKILIGISNFFRRFWYLIGLALAALIIFVAAYRKTPEGRLFFGKLLISIPIIRNLTRNIITARLTRTLGTLMASGVLLIQSMEVVAKVVGNAVIENKINDAIEEIKKGRGLTAPIMAMRYFSPLLISMIRIGEESGNLDFALDKAADFYDQEVETSVQQLTSIIEPLIIVFLALTVGFIVLSVLYPMFKLYDQFMNL